MKAKKSTNKFLVKSSAFISILFLFCSLFGSPQAKAQKINIERAGFNKIKLYNRAAYSLTFQIGSQQKFTLAPRTHYDLPFPLTALNIQNTPIVTTYDVSSYNNDCRICNETAERELKRNDAFHLFLTTLATLFSNNYNFEKTIAVLASIGPLLGLPTRQLNAFIRELTEVWTTDLSPDEKKKRMEAIGRSYLLRTDEIEIERLACLALAEKRLINPSTETYYAKQFILPQEKSNWELTAFVVAGNRVRMFRQVGNVNTIQRLGYDAQPAYGLRAAFSFNAYKGGVRKPATKYYIPVTVTQSPVVYKGVADSVFTKQTGFSWRTYSIGWGWEGLYSSKVSSLFLDLGVLTSSLFKHKVESERVVATSSESSFKGFVPYINVGLKMKLTRWLDVYGSYYSTLLYSSLKYDKQDSPSFREFHFGLTCNFGRHYSYQY